MDELEQQLQEHPESEDEQSGQQASEAIQEPEARECYSEILLFCHPRNVSNLVQSFEDEIKHAAGELPMRVLWSGQSGLLHQGVVLLEWEGPLSSRLLQNLSGDHEIFDYVIYHWTGSEEENGEDHVFPIIEHLL
jgi:hypothetical protein